MNKVKKVKKVKVTQLSAEQQRQVAKLADFANHSTENLNQCAYCPDIAGTGCEWFYCSEADAMWDVAAALRGIHARPRPAVLITRTDLLEMGFAYRTVDERHLRDHIPLAALSVPGVIAPLYAADTQSIRWWLIDGGHRATWQLRDLQLQTISVYPLTLGESLRALCAPDIKIEDRTCPPYDLTEQLIWRYITQRRAFNRR